MDGRIVEGVVKESEVAREEYHQSIKTGRSAFLLEEKLPDLFKVNFAIATVVNIIYQSGRF